MKVVKSDVLGFCFGVRRAVEMIENELKNNGPLCTLGAIVHNTHVVSGLSDEGGQLVHSLDEVPKNGAVAITAHGAGEEIYKEIKHRNLRLIDTTCPIVRRAQETAATLVKDGFFVLLYGEKDHPEVKGILSWTRGKGEATMSSEVAVPSEVKRIAVISQTTKKRELFAEFAQQITGQYASKLEEIRIIDTTCPETGRRYQAARELAHQVEALFVVGSHSSANTRKLAETCRETKIPTYHIDSAYEVKGEWLAGVSRVGVTAGASTPDYIIDEVVSQLEDPTERKTRVERG